MIFTKDHIALIRAGEKTQTRRFERPRIKVGNTYKLNTQFYKKEKFGRIKVIGLWQEKLGAVTTSDAKKLGYRSKPEYLAALSKIHRRRLDLRRVVWVVDFEFVT